MARLPQRLETARLLLRLPTAEDAGPLNAAILASHAELNRWMEWAQEPQALAETRSFCQESFRSWREETACNLLMVETQSGEIVGSCGYPRLNWPVPAFEIGYWCRTDRVGRGYVTEATWALTRHAFEALGANRVEIRTDDLNRRSWRVAERLGFRLEATLRNEVRSPNGRLRDTRIYGAIALGELSAPRLPAGA
jgi:RimJ/RimL family protein N-acetyltransferase